MQRHQKQMKLACSNFLFRITWLPEREEYEYVRCQTNEPNLHFFSLFLETLVSNVAFWAKLTMLFVRDNPRSEII